MVGFNIFCKIALFNSQEDGWPLALGGLVVRHVL